MSSSSSSSAKKILNGIVGDYLDATGNELSTEMTLFIQNELALDVARGFPVIANNKDNNDDDAKQQPRVCFLVHGLVDDEHVWLNNQRNLNYGEHLQQDLGFLPLYLRYNTGLHISTNGRKLNQLLQTMWSNTTSAIPQEIVFVCHSMGGLVVRSACSYGLDQNAPWMKRVAHIVFLGTPHQGSYWEKAGNVFTNSLDRIPRPYMKLAAQVGNLRSDGIKDLRYGYIRDEDWNINDNGQNQDDLLTNTRTKAALMDWTCYHVVTGTITENPNHILSQWFGDALVHKNSARGQSQVDQHHLPFEDFCEFPGVSHTKLANHPLVYDKIKEWLAQPCTRLPDLPSLVARQPDNGQAQSQSPPSTTTANRGKYDDWKGGSTLLHDTVHAGVSAVGDVQRQLTSEVYSVLSKWSLIAPMVKKVQVVHETSVDVVYGSILTVNDATRTITRYAIDQVETMQQPQTTQQE